MDQPIDPLRGLEVRWLGRIGYRDAWELQHRLVSARASGRIGDQLLLLEHPPVLTLGRHADEAHVLAGPVELGRRGIEVIRVERGGEVTYHGPGQLVAYPILALERRGLLLRPLVRALESAMIETCAAFGVTAGRREGHPGCWCDPDGPIPRKIGALGIRVERGVTYHGIALNVSVDLADFGLIDACGMPGVVSTSIEREAARRDDGTGGDRPGEGALASDATRADGARAGVASAAGAFAVAVAGSLGAALSGNLPPAADGLVEREVLARLAADALAASSRSGDGATAAAGSSRVGS